jgi:hypothetical protein
MHVHTSICSYEMPRENMAEKRLVYMNVLLSLHIHTLMHIYSCIIMSPVRMLGVAWETYMTACEHECTACVCINGIHATCLLTWSFSRTDKTEKFPSIYVRTSSNSGAWPQRYHDHTQGMWICEIAGRCQVNGQNCCTITSNHHAVK